MSSPNTYLLTEKVIAMIEEAKLSLHALRLVHSMLAYVDGTYGLDLGMLALPTKPPCRVLTSVVAAQCGPRNAKSLAWVRTAVDELQQGHCGGLLLSVALSEDGRHLSFKPGSKAMAAAQRGSKTPFALLDRDEVAAISSSRELLFLTRARMIARAKLPMFRLPGIGPEGEPWHEANRKAWLRIAARVGQRLGQDYLIIPKADPVEGHLLHVVVKTSTPHSCWEAGRLYPRHPAGALGLVQGGTFRSLARAEVRARNSWTRVGSPC